MKTKQHVTTDAAKKGRIVLIIGLVVIAFTAAFVWIFEH